MKVLAICGSIRKESSNLALLRAMRKLAPAGMEFAIYEGLERLPYFNPDLDGETPPDPIRTFRAEIASADVLVISTPEYAHGIPGVLKNTLDWLVADPLFGGKKIGLVYGSATEGSHLAAALTEVLRTMSADLVAGAVASIPSVRTKITPTGEVGDPATAAELVRVLTVLKTAST